MNADKYSSKSVGKRTKVNKNAVPRRSKWSLRSEHSITKVEQSEHTGKRESQLPESSPEFNEEADSAFGSITPNTTSDSLEEDKLDLEPDNDVFTIPDSASANSKKLEFVVPKFPVLQSSRSVQTEYGNRKMTILQQNKALPKGIVAPLSSTLCRKEQTDDVRTDGPQSEVIPPESRGPMSSVTKTGSSSSCTQLNHTNGMSDFVILHTDDDAEGACCYKTHLQRDIGINDLTVDLLSNIDAGKSEFQSLGSLHERYRHILTYVTDNLGSDRYCRFMQEIIITCGLREANGKEDRVVPVFTQKGRCNIIEISVLNGFQYFKFCSGGQMKNLYIDSVKRLVEKGRRMFPLND